MSNPSNPVSAPAWHAQPEDEVLTALEARREGLSPAEARRRLQIYGRNRLEGAESGGLWRMILHQVKSPLIYLLAGAAVVSVLVDHHVDALFIALVVLLNTVVGVVQEWRAEQAIDALRRLAAPRARVWRGGDREEIDAEEVVRGDVLELEEGEAVPADARVLESYSLQVAEAALTGESAPVAKAPGILEEDTPLAERTNMVWTSTHVTSGRGRAVVVATGMETSMGEIASAVQGADRLETPLQVRMRGLGQWLGAAALGMAALVAAIGLLRGYEVMEMILFGVAVAVSAIPEGLPVVVSVALAVGVHRMARRHAIIRRLPAVETLGSTTIICTDKTGTITKNEMTVTRVWADGATFAVTGEGYAPQGDLRAESGDKVSASAPASPALRRLLEVGVLANEAALVQRDGQWRIDGDPTEGALLVVAKKLDIDPRQLNDRYARLDTIPFASEREYMATLHADPEGGPPLVCVKGAPERVLSFCSHTIEGGEPVPLDDARRRAILDANHAFAGDALRVLGGASREGPGTGDAIGTEHAEQGLTFLGLWGMIDPPRPSAVEAIADAQTAGIRVVMLTGDHAETAAAIAHQVGVTPERIQALTGRDIGDLTEDALAEKALRSRVFARVSPTHKLDILRALQSRNEIVAMTGDGVNDAPALKSADIGVAMGITGTDVAREAADMVLTDDNFATIVHAVEEGRVIFGNLQRAIFFLITTGAAEVLTLSSALFLGLPLPLTPVMIIWINLVTAGPTDIPLGIEPKHGDVLQEPPRPVNAPLVNGSMIWRVLILGTVVATGTLGMFLYYFYMENDSYAKAQTVAFTTLVVFQWFQAFAARDPVRSLFSIGILGNRWLLLGVGAAMLLQLGALYLPIGQTLFGVVPLGIPDWLVIVAVASTVLIVDEIRKAVIRSRLAPV